MKALLEKELRALAPYLLGALMCGVMVALEDVLGPFRPYDVDTPASDSLSGWLFISGLFAFAAGHSAISREFVDGQIEFLDGLPVRRTTIYFAKVIAGSAVPLILWLSVVGNEFFVSELNASRTSLPYTATLVWSAKLYGVGIVSFYAMGLLLAWFNELAWGLLALGTVVLTVLAELSPPLRRLNILGGYAVLEYDGASPIDNPIGLWFWAVITLFAIFVSWLMFLGPGELMLRSGSKLIARFRFHLLIIFGGLFVLMTGLAALTQFSSWTERFSPASKIVRTQRFQILYDTRDEAAALEIVAIADTIDDLVQETLHIDDDIPLDLELFRPANDFHAGEQSGGKIRLGATENAPSILAHELTHAHAQSLTGAAGLINAEAWRFFNEGLASWVEGQVYGDPTKTDELRLWAAAIYDADQHRFDLLVVDEIRRRRYDTFQVYPLGFVWAETIVAEHGTEAPRCLLEQLGALEGDNYAPIAIWYGIFAGCGFSLDDTVAAYDRRLAKYADDYGVVDVLLAGRVAGSDRKMIVNVVDERHAGLPLFCRFRRNADSDVSEMRQIRVRAGQCPVPYDVTGSASFEYQLGFQLSDLAVMYRPWVTAPVR